MKNIFNICIIALLISVTVSSAVETEQIGIGLGSSTVPFDTRFPSIRSFMLYKASDIIAAGGSAGEITAVSYNVSMVGPAMNNFSIKMRMTSFNDLTAISDWNTGFTDLYSSPNYVFTSTGWKTINFSSPFPWNGTDNIIIQICFSNSSTNDNCTVISCSFTEENSSKHRWPYYQTDACVQNPDYSMPFIPNLKLNINIYNPPTVQTLSSTSYSNNTVDVVSNITADGGMKPITRGVCWSTSPMPDITGVNKIVESGSFDNGAFTSTIATLNPGTVYYVRAYATNWGGTGYGNQIQSVAIPTLGEWGLILFGSLIAVIGGIVVWRRLV